MFRVYHRRKPGIYSQQPRSSIYIMGLQHIIHQAVLCGLQPIIFPHVACEPTQNNRCDPLTYNNWRPVAYIKWNQKQLLSLLVENWTTA